MLTGPIYFVFLSLVFLAIIVALIYARRANRIRERLESEYQQQIEALAPVPDENMNWLSRWLFVSGIRTPAAAPVFVAVAMSAVLVGLVLAFAITASPILDAGREKLRKFPGEIGVLFEPAIVVMPWIAFLIIACLPWLYVRAQRRKRVTEVEEDLPISLQVMATLARAGLGFDASLLRLLESADPDRTLPDEFATFRRENMGGIPREQCWRRLSKRIEVSSISIFVSAMVHAEQVGGGISEVLEHQTEDVQNRRREHALIKAQALPVKLVFPLVICFLPGIFVWTLGPTVYDFGRALTGFTR